MLPNKFITEPKFGSDRPTNSARNSKPVRTPTRLMQNSVIDQNLIADILVNTEHLCNSRDYGTVFHLCGSISQFLVNFNFLLDFE